MSRFQHGIRRLSAVLIGLVFFVAGMLKLMDPVGTGLIAGEYLKFLHLQFLAPLSKGLGVVIALTETILGASLVSGVARKLTAIAVSAVLGCFTVLTLFLLIFNPEMDCGCFGEVVHLSHLQSFAKNVVLCLLAVVAFVPLTDGFGARKPKKWGFGIVCCLVAAFCVYSLRNLPLVDFTDFSRGEFVLPMEGNAGGSESVLSILDASGEYMDWQVADGDLLLVSAYEPGKIGREVWDKLPPLFESALQNGLTPMLVVPDASEVPFELQEYACSADRKSLLTLNRSNGGATMLSDALVVRKWPARSYPSSEELSAVMSADPLETVVADGSACRLTFQGLTLFSLALLLLI